MEQNITYSKIIKELKKFQEQSPFLKSFGQGNLVDFGKDDENETPLYPMMFVIPTSVEYNDNTTTYGLQVIIADRLNDDLEGNEYIISDCQQIGRDLIGQIKRGFLFDVMDITYPVISQPFQERFNDVLAGISMDLSVEVDDGNDVCLLQTGVRLYYDFTYFSVDGISASVIIADQDSEGNQNQIYNHNQTTGGTGQFTGYFDIDPLNYEYLFLMVSQSPQTYNFEIKVGNEVLYEGTDLTFFNTLYQTLQNEDHYFTFKMNPPTSTIITTEGGDPITTEDNTTLIA